MGGKGRDDDDNDDGDDLFGDLEGLDDLVGGGSDDKKEPKKRPATSSGRGPMKKPSRKNEDGFEAWFMGLYRMAHRFKSNIVKYPTSSFPSFLSLPLFLSPWVQWFRQRSRCHSST